MILLSYAFYIPVILFVQQMPMIGVWMIPKTIAYVGIAPIAHYSLFRQPASKEVAKPASRPQAPGARRAGGEGRLMKKKRSAFIAFTMRPMPTGARSTPLRRSAR